jgi:menaquinone-dependent protoporphyrinogen oxidase
VSDCLVAFATRHGATAEIGEALAEALRRADHRAEVRPADYVETLEPYDAVILGSAVYQRRPPTTSTADVGLDLAAHAGQCLLELD